MSEIRKLCERGLVLSSETKDILCAEQYGWSAAPHLYDLLHNIVFFADGTGLMRSGGNQSMREAVGFKYVITADGKIVFEYGTTTSRNWGTKYDADKINPTIEIPFEIEDGIFIARGLYDTTDVYRKVLKLGKNPFPKNADAHGKEVLSNRDFTGNDGFYNFYGGLLPSDNTSLAISIPSFEREIMLRIQEKS